MACPNGEPSYSYTRLETFRKCPRKFKLKYLEEEEEAFESVEAFMGRIVHQALAWAFERHQRGLPPSEAEVIARYDASWRKAVSPRVRAVKRDDSLYARQQLGERLLRRFLTGPYRNERRRTEAVEREFTIKLKRRYSFAGFVDRVARDQDGSLHIIDFKTTGSPPSRIDSDGALQLEAYGLASVLLWKVPEVRLEYHFLANGESISWRFTNRQAAQTVDVLVDRIEETLRETSFDRRPSNLCRWCGYQRICAGDGSGAKESCPWCGSALRLKEGRRGPFISCGDFPNCRYSRDA